MVKEQLRKQDVLARLLFTVIYHDAGSFGVMRSQNGHKILSEFGDQVIGDLNLK